MIIDEKIIVKNYKCFDSIGGGFEKIYPINIIVGKNNSGKSSLIDLVQYVVALNDSPILKGRDDKTPEVEIIHRLTNTEVSTVFSSDRADSRFPGDNLFSYGKKFIDKLYTYELSYQGDKTFKSIEVDFILVARDLVGALSNTIKSPFIKNKLFCNITAERDIVSELSSKDTLLLPNGVGATNYIHQIINNINQDSRLIESDLLRELNLIVNPDIKFTRILVQFHENNKWELFFEDANNKRIALSKMGSGVKTVLLVLLNLIVRPIIEGRNKDMYVFAFEELENNLHPSLQRRLYNYIINYSEKFSTYFFLTTHSNIVIDAFGTYKNAQLIHVTNDGDKSISSTILTYDGNKQVLNDLGIKASDILQSNGVIWVEGPSDRNYLNKWLELLAPDLKEGLHYSIMFYGGRLLANLSFDFKWFNRDVIPLLKINKNAFVVIDRDGKTMKAPINETKKRVNDEIGSDNCWITSGREIENYLSDETISKWLEEKCSCKTKFVNNKDKKIEDNISSDGKIKLKYNLSKTLYSSEISPYINKDSLDVLDLRQNLDRLIACIKKWNHIVF